MLGLARRIGSRLRRGRRRQAINGSLDVNFFNLIFIEPCFNSCNLRCPYCPVGQGLKLKDMSRGMMSLDLFRQIWAKSFARYRGKIGLYNWGEPFLNPDLPGMVRHVKENSPASLVLNSNFSFRFDDRVTEIVKRLDSDRIVISCDGYSQETCERYRVNVDFGLVMHNIELIVRHKKQQTKLLWQYLRFPWNLHEVEAAEEFASGSRSSFIWATAGSRRTIPSCRPPAPRPTAGSAATSSAIP